MNKNQRGFSHTVVVLLVVLLGLIGFAAWNVLKKDPNKSYESKSSATSTTTVKKTEPSKTADIVWETYKNDEAGITFKYPNTWKSVAADTFRYDDGEFGGVGGTVTAPDSSNLTWIFQIAGGKGGDCEPDVGDIAFTSGNKCSSKQTIKVEKAQSIKQTKTEFRPMFGDSLFITQTKHMDTSGKTTYQICLDPYYTSETSFHRDETPQLGTTMGLLFPCEIWDTGFNAKFEVKSEKDFDSTNAQTAQEIMKSFNSI